MFKLSNTNPRPGSAPTVARGFPAPGAGAQTTGAAPPAQRFVARKPQRPTQGIRSWFRPGGPTGGQQGFPEVLNADTVRPAGSMPNNPPLFPAEPIYVYTPYYSRGTAAYVPNVGVVLSNPIGAGIVARYRPQASYGGAAQYDNGALWWTSQVIPTTVNLQGLTDPAVLNEQLGSLLVQAVVRTTG